MRQRNQHIKSINEDGVLAWRRTFGCSRQSAVENMFSRYKTLMGDHTERGEKNLSSWSLVSHVNY